MVNACFNECMSRQVFPLPQKVPSAPSQLVPFYFRSQSPSEATILISMTCSQFILYYSRIFYKWNHIICTFLCFFLGIEFSSFIHVVLTLQSNIPLYEYKAAYLYILLLVDIRIVFHYYLQGHHEHSYTGLFCEQMLSFLLGNYVGMQLPDNMAGIVLSEYFKYFFSPNGQYHSLYLPAVQVPGSDCLMTSPPLSLFRLFTFDSPVGHVVVSHCGFNVHFPGH